MNNQIVDETKRKYNEQARLALQEKEKRNFFSHALALFALEGSPVIKKLQQEQRITKKEIEELQLFTASRLGGVWELIQEEKWMELELFFDYFTERLKEAPRVNPDSEATQRLIQLSVENSL